MAFKFEVEEMHPIFVFADVFGQFTPKL